MGISAPSVTKTSFFSSISCCFLEPSEAKHCNEIARPFSEPFGSWACIYSTVKVRRHHPLTSGMHRTCFHVPSTRNALHILHATVLILVLYSQSFFPGLKSKKNTAAFINSTPGNATHSIHRHPGHFPPESPRLRVCARCNLLRQVTRWRKEPYSRGSYSYVAVGAYKADYAALAVPVSGDPEVDRRMENGGVCATPALGGDNKAPPSPAARCGDPAAWDRPMAAGAPVVAW